MAIQNEPLRSQQILDGLFNQYKVVELIDSDEISSSPSIKPHTLSPRLRRERPSLYKGETLNGKRSVAIKAVGSTGRQSLMDEWRALNRLNIYHQLIFSRPISPRVYENISDLENSSSFFVFEWLDGEKWINLASIIRQNSPLIYWNDNCSITKRLSTALISSAKKMHRLKVCHGDLKDEHVFVHKRNDGYDFSDIRIIDFGTSYLRQLEDWKGGSIGFTPPNFWDPSRRVGLQRKRLELLDWYGVFAVLYYAYTGETFPTASPAFRELSENSLKNFSREFYDALNVELRKRWQGYDDCVSVLLQDLIDRLCKQEFFF